MHRGVPGTPETPEGAARTTDGGRPLRAYYGYYGSGATGGQEALAFSSVFAAAAGAGAGLAAS